MYVIEQLKKLYEVYSNREEIIDTLNRAIEESQKEWEEYRRNNISEVREEKDKNF